MSLRIAFNGGPLDGTVIASDDEEISVESCQFLPSYIFRATRHGRVGASFETFNPRELPEAISLRRALQLHQYRIYQRHIGDDATILMTAEYVGVTGRTILPTRQAIRQWAGEARSLNQQGPERGAALLSRACVR